MKCVVFVDDLNMPQLEVYGAQPPVEILRQVMDYDGWYDRTELTFRKLVDIQFCAAMGPPGGGRNPITARFQRHFNLVSICEFDDASYRRIYETIVDWWSRSVRLDSAVDGKTKALITATLDIYNTIRQQLLPTPTKSHYTYNMRDMSKVFQGVSMVGSAPADTASLVRLWAHESQRIFHDRLVSDEDRLWFCNYLKEMINKHVGLKFEDVFRPPGADKGAAVELKEMDRIMFGDFMVPGAENPKYEEILSQQKLVATIEEYLADYNTQVCVCLQHQGLSTKVLPWALRVRIQGADLA
jgi:dynein heavy chain